MVTAVKDNGNIAEQRSHCVKRPLRLKLSIYYGQARVLFSPDSKAQLGWHHVSCCIKVQNSIVEPLHTRCTRKKTKP